MAYYTTLTKIRQHSPCKDGWEKLLRSLGKTEADDEPLSLMTILDSNGLDDTLWCLRACDDVDKEARLFAVWCARQVQHLMTGPEAVAAIDVAERYATGAATEAELAAAWVAAETSARLAACDAACDAARFEACDAACDAAREAARAAACDAARDPSMFARYAARDAAMAAQEAEFRRRFGEKA